MTTRFRKHYDELPDERVLITPKREWIDKVADKCKVSPVTVKCWLYGEQRPDALRLSILAKMIGCKPEEVFAEV